MQNSVCLEKTPKLGLCTYISPLSQLSAVAVMKDEGRNIREWLMYHMLMGIEHFYLYNNDNADDEVQMWHLLTCLCFCLR
jgi:hypothetical protein